LVLGILSAMVFFATFLGYGTTLWSILVSYLVASVWFVLRRFQYVDRDTQFTAPLPRPRGY